MDNTICLSLFCLCVLVVGYVLWRDEQAAAEADDDWDTQVTPTLAGIAAMSRNDDDWVGL